MRATGRGGAGEGDREGPIGYAGNGEIIDDLFISKGHRVLY